MSELYAVADFCLVPIGTGESSVAEHVAECQRILQKSGLTYRWLRNKSRQVYFISFGTLFICPPPPLLEGPWSQVTKAIHDCHIAVHAIGAPRIATDVRIGTRIDRQLEPGKANDHKVTRVMDILAQDDQSSSSDSSFEM